MEQNLNAVQKLSRDLAMSAVSLSDDEARFLVDAYYMMQDNRIRTAGQIRSMSSTGEPHAVLAWLLGENEVLEKQVARALDKYSAASPVGEWARSQKGIGPIIAAGLLAHIDITKCPTAGHIWSFAGLDPRVKWHSAADIAQMAKDAGKDIDQVIASVAAKIGRSPGNILRLAQTFARKRSKEEGEDIAVVEITREDALRALKTRPWNASLKTLCWKIGESFVKVSGDENAFYGQLYRKRKLQELADNDVGKFAAQAAAKLENFNIGKGTDAYKAYAAGRLPPAHIHARAKRYAVKMFLSHLHDVWYREHFEEAPPKPFAIAMLGHAHYIEPPSQASGE